MSRAIALGPCAFSHSKTARSIPAMGEALSLGNSGLVATKALGTIPLTLDLANGIEHPSTPLHSEAVRARWRRSRSSQATPARRTTSPPSPGRWPLSLMSADRATVQHAVGEPGPDELSCITVERACVQ